MLACQVQYLGWRHFPAELSEFEISRFFTFEPEVHRAIRSRWKDTLRLAEEGGVSVAGDREMAEGVVGIVKGALFRRLLIGRNQVGEPLNPGSVAPIFERVAQWIGMAERIVDKVSGHSIRVGATQDLAELDIDLAAIMQAGGWKSTRMPLQYAQKINAARSGNGQSGGEGGKGLIMGGRLHD
jgi:hypothetical protein